MTALPQKALFASVAVVLAACQPLTQANWGASYPPAYYEMSQAGAAPSYGVPVADVEPAAGRAPDVSYEARRQQDNRVEGLQAALAKADERLQRVEKAMLRLDRRMQLVERNELGRMASGSENAPLAMVEGGLGGDVQPSYQEGFRPVSNAITATLQAAPRQMAMNGVSTKKTGLPSLADPSPAVGKAMENDLSVWTVSYQAEKVWPERDQLPGSRDIVAALRDGGAATLFARGKHPNSVEFRERVKALSRYLGKVASLESVPISAIPAPNLDDDTIEVFAAH